MIPSSWTDLLRRYLHDDCTEGEAWTVDQWYEARDMPRPAPPTPTEATATKAAAWHRIQQRTQPRLGWQQPPLRWAAAALLVLGLGLALGHFHAPSGSGPGNALALQTESANGWTTCRNPTAGRPRAVHLSDGSTVTLQPGSCLRYPQQFTGPERCVSLRGEAFFQVFHNARQPFRVLTDRLQTTVLGTSFTVRAWPGVGGAAVAVRTGRVRVSATPAAGSVAGSPALVLLPNQQAVLVSAARVLRAELVAQPAALAPEVQRFDERPVAEVLAALQATYGVPIRYDGAALAGCTVSVAFGHEPLFEKLDLLCRILEARYERTDEAIIFRSRGCQPD